MIFLSMQGRITKFQHPKKTPFWEESKGNIKKRRNKFFIVTTMFCLQCLRAAHALKSDQFSSYETFIYCNVPLICCDYKFTSWFSEREVNIDRVQPNTKAPKPEPMKFKPVAPLPNLSTLSEN